MACLGTQGRTDLLGFRPVIFATVGSMLPFERFVRMMDAWAADHPSEEVFVQIGRGQYEPSHAAWARMLDSAAFDAKIQSATLIVAHAGTGTVFAALAHRKPIVLVPRYADQKEHTTDHQLHTAAWLKQKPGIVICSRGEDLAVKIEEARHLGSAVAGIPQHASPEFLTRLRSAIQGFLSKR